MTLIVTIVVCIIALELAILIWGSWNWFQDSLQHYIDVKSRLAHIEKLLVPPVNYDGSIGQDQGAIVTGESPIGQEEKEKEEDIGVKIPDTLTYKA